MANILYLSSHEILEFDEISLFSSMGHNVFSLGAYQTSNKGTGMRGEILNLYDNPHLRSVALQCNKENIHEELIGWMDFCISMHNSRVDVDDHPQPWLKGNWEKFKKSGKPIIWRSIGQSNRQIEKSLKEFRKDGLKIVRYSPLESTILDYQGSDAMIRFYKNPDEYKDWNGQNPRIVTVAQAMFGGETVRSRGDHMSLPFFEKVVEGFDWKVFGPDNENAGEHNGGMLSFEDLKQMLRFNRVYFYTGTRPASYTLGVIEAMMTGIPIVSVGPEQGNNVYTDQRTFEMPEILGLNKECGLWTDNIIEARDYLDMLLKDHKFSNEMSQKGRARAIELFGRDSIMKEWENFFKTL